MIFKMVLSAAALMLARTVAAQCTGTFNSQTSDTSDLYGCSGSFFQWHNLHVFDNLCCASFGSNVTITVSAHGDFGGGASRLDLILNGVTVVPDLFDGANGRTNCFPELFYSVETAVVPAAQFNQALQLDPQRTATFWLESTCSVERLCPICGNCPQNEVTIVQLQYQNSSTCGCTSSSQCSDGLFCTNDVCSGGNCSNPTNSCSDSNSCTNDSCNESSNTCSHTNKSNGTSCGSGNVCCSGVCRDCCTDVNCTGGQHCCSNVCRECCSSSDCDDGDVCTGTDTCVANNCSVSITDCNVNLVEDFCDIGNGTSHDCDGDMVPDECQGGSVGAALITRVPDHDETLPRVDKNTMWLTFACDIQAPTAGDVVIQELLNGGAFGADMSSSFTFSVLNTAGGFPRILKIVESTQALTHRKWYAVRNTGSWSSAQPFEVHYLVQMGDADNNSTVDFADLSFISTSIPTLSPVPDPLRRKDVSAYDFSNFTDLSVARANALFV